VRNSYETLIGNLKERKHLRDVGVTKRIIIKLIVKNSILGSKMNSCGSKYRALISEVMNIQIPKQARNLLTNLATVSFSSRVLFHAVIIFTSFPVKH
jgi:hypothetical protein